MRPHWRLSAHWIVASVVNSKCHSTANHIHAKSVFDSDVAVRIYFTSVPSSEAYLRLENWVSFWWSGLMSERSTFVSLHRIGKCRCIAFGRVAYTLCRRRDWSAGKSRRSSQGRCWVVDWSRFPAAGGEEAGQAGGGRSGLKERWSGWSRFPLAGHHSWRW